MLNMNPVVNLYFAVGGHDLPITHDFNRWDEDEKILVFRRDEMKVYNDKLYAYHFDFTTGNKHGYEDVTHARLVNVRQMADNINKALGNIGTIRFGTRTNMRNDAFVMVGLVEIGCHISRYDCPLADHDAVWFTVKIPNGDIRLYPYEKEGMEFLLNEIKSYLQ